MRQKESSIILINQSEKVNKVDETSHDTIKITCYLQPTTFGAYSISNLFLIYLTVIYIYIEFFIN